MNGPCFIRCRIGITTLDNESGWRVVIQMGDHEPRFSEQSWGTREEARAMAELCASTYESGLTEAGIPWGKT